jgi:hypothetical protein
MSEDLYTSKMMSGKYILREGLVNGGIVQGEGRGLQK